MLVVEPVEPGQMLLAHDRRVGALRERKEVLGVRAPRRRLRAGRGEPLGGVLADGLEQPVTRRAAPPLGLHEALVDERVQQVEHVVAAASAASRSKPPANTDSRSSNARSGGSSSSYDQSTVARSVCWRGIAERLPRVSSAKRRSSRSWTSAIDIERIRAAASSIASGIPSSRRQIALQSAALPASSSNS
jgi:hypothetical protein